VVQARKPSARAGLVVRPFLRLCIAAKARSPGLAQKTPSKFGSSAPPPERTVARPFTAVPASGSVTVRYTYVPEPSALALLSVGGILLKSRRRRAA